MPVQYYSIPTERLESQLPGISRFIEWSLWIKPHAHSYDSGVMRALMRTFEPLKGVLWQATSSSTKSIYVPFQAWPNAIGETIMEGSSTYPALKRVVRYKVAWAIEGEPEAATESMWPLNYPLSSHVNLSFLPKDQFTAIKWANIIQGPQWLWLCDEWIANSPQPALAAAEVTLSYLRLTLEIGGIPSLIWVDSDTASGLTCFGSKVLMESAAQKLKALGAEFHPQIFERFLDRHFHFAMCL